MAASLGKQAVVIGAGILRNSLPLAQSAIILKMSLSWSVTTSAARGPSCRDPASTAHARAFGWRRARA